MRLGSALSGRAHTILWTFWLQIRLDVLAGATFKDGIRVTDDDADNDDETTGERVAA